jgi:single-strand DNA-binding protein
MRSINTVILIGNAIRDAEFHATKSGKPVSNIRLATNWVVGGEERSQFHSVICGNRLAETTAAYVKKGDPFYVEGKFEYRSFQDEEGTERGACETTASDVGVLSRRPAADETTDPLGSTPVTTTSRRRTSRSSRRRDG